MAALVEREQLLPFGSVVAGEPTREELLHLVVGKLVRRRTDPAVLVLDGARHERDVGRVRRRSRIPLVPRNDRAIDDRAVAQTRDPRLAVESSADFLPIDLLNALELVLRNAEL